MSDLFEAFGESLPTPRQGRAAVPWSDVPGFLISEPWRAYCEAWDHASLDWDAYKDSCTYDLRTAERVRGKAAVEALRHNIDVVKRDVLGKIQPRRKLFELIR